MELAIEQLPYALSASAYAMVRIADAQIAAVASVKARQTEKLGTLTVYQMKDAEYFPISFGVD
jgi:hypothetical protein